MTSLSGLGSLDSPCAILVDRTRGWREQRCMPVQRARSVASPFSSTSTTVACPAVALALRHSPQLLFFRAPERLERLRRGVAEAAAPTALTGPERLFYAAQLWPAGRPSLLLLQQQQRPRAASAPALPVARRSLWRRGTAKPQRRRWREKCGRRAAHLCRRVKCLQEAYIFHPDADRIGDGAFSRVFRAVRAFGASSIAAQNPFVALKVIPRRQTQEREAQRARTLGGERAPVLEHTRAQDRNALPNLLENLAATPLVPPPPVVSSTHRHGKLDERCCELEDIGREISILRSVRHTGCSEFVEALCTPDEFVIVMKMGNKSIDARRYLELYGPPSETRVSLIIYQLLETVNYLHLTHGIVHRDIKLENLLLSYADVSCERIRQVLGREIPHVRRKFRQSRGDSKSTGDPKGRKYEESHDSSERDWEESKEAKKGQVIHGTAEEEEEEEDDADVSKRGVQSVLQWGSAVRQHEYSDFERLLKVTLIDFGIARRTDRHMEPRHRSDAEIFGTQHTVSCESSATHRVFHSDSGEVLIGETKGSDGSSTSRSLEEKEEEEEEVDDGSIARKQRNEGWDIAVARRKDEASAAPIASRPTAIIPIHHLHPRHETSGSIEGHSARTDSEGNTSLVNSSSSLWAPHSLVSAESPIFSSLDYSYSEAAAGVVPETVSLPSRSSISTPVPPTLRAASAVDDAERMLLLAPCGTDRYLPPEMLSWKVSCGWKAKATTVRLARQLDSYAIGIVAYVLLSGCFPFNGKSRASMAQQKQRCAPKCNSERWSSISRDAVSLVQSLLEPEIHERMSVADALTHPWIRHASHLANKLDLVPAPIDACLTKPGAFQVSQVSLSQSETIQRGPRLEAQHVTPPQNVTSMDSRHPCDEVIDSGSSASRRCLVLSSFTQSQGAKSIYVEMAAAAKEGKMVEESSGKDDNDDTDEDNDLFTRIFKSVMSE